MKKRLLSAAALLALAGAAQAQVSIYGLIDVSYGKSLYSDIFNRKAEFHSGGDNGSSEGNSTTRVGVKGTYDLGGGTKANFKFETGGITKEGKVTYDDIACENLGDCDQGSFFNRQAWFGLSGSWGEFRVGRQDSVVFQTMADFDFNGASNGVSAGAYTGIGVFARGRQSGAVNYIAPAMGGVTAQIGYQPKQAVKSQYGLSGTEKDVVSAGVKFASGPIALGVAYESKIESGAKDFVSVAGTYDFGVAKVMAGYTDAGKVASGGAGKGYTLGVQAPVAGFTVGAIYAANTDDSADIKSYELFVNKELFKNTYGYVEGGSWKSGSTKFNGYAVGLIFVF